MNEFWRSIDAKPQNVEHSEKVYFEFDDFLDEVASILSDALGKCCQRELFYAKVAIQNTCLD